MGINKDHSSEHRWNSDNFGLSLSNFGSNSAIFSPIKVLNTLEDVYNYAPMSVLSSCGNSYSMKVDRDGKMYRRRGIYNV